MKVCRDCGEEKEYAEFYRSSHIKDGYNSWCKICTRKRKAASNAKRVSEMGEIADRLRRKEYVSRYRSKYPERVARSSRHQKLKKFGWSIDAYEEQYAVQEGRCYVCDLFKEVLHADHDHTTGKPRKLLCSNCNTALGLLKEDIKIMQNLIDYVGEH